MTGQTEYRKLLHSGKVFQWIAAQIWKKLTKFIKTEIRIHMPLVFRKYLIIQDLRLNMECTKREEHINLLNPLPHTVSYLMKVSL